MWRDDDTIELNGVRVSGTREGPPAAGNAQGSDASSAFLSVWFRCCHVYGRMTRNRERTAYEGRCPGCGAAVRARIGPQGTSRKVFEAM